MIFKKNLGFTPVLRRIRGFTLIELVVVIAIVGITLPVFFSLVYGLTREQFNVATLQRVKQEGDFARQVIAETVRSRALSINAACTGLTMPATKICFYDENGAPFGYGYTAASGLLASYSATVTTTLVGGAVAAKIPVTVTDATFTASSARTVAFDIELTHTPLSTYLDTQTLTYQFYVVLRR